MRAALAALVLWPGAALAQTDFTALTPEERAIFRDEIRAVLLDNPELARPRAPAARDIYAADIDSDLSLIRAHRAALFGPALPKLGPADAKVAIALFTGPDCPACARAIADLRALAETRALRVHLIHTETHAGLARAMGVDTLPFYVFPKMMLRGHMPAPVIARYLDQGTGF